MNPYLRAADRLRKEAELKLQARQAEEQTERARDEEGLLTADGELITASHTFAIDEVGTITKGGEYDPETGEVITPPKVLRGWHVNYAGEPPEA